MEADIGSFQRSTLNNLLEENEYEEIGKDDPEAAIRLSWFELIPRNNREFNMLQGLAHRRRKPFRTRCRDKFATVHRKQIIMKIGP
ncbi:hypothetical protein GCM10007880_67120 [Mesorhizobium amorphae]|nr:hypothetical protein GCM10007880_67120 [Mesorhizobium amorphae]